MTPWSTQRLLHRDKGYSLNLDTNKTIFHFFLHLNNYMVSVDGLAVEFGGTTLFSDISFVINEKDRIALMGKNGAGKSTLLSVAAGIERQDAGKIELAPLGRGQLGYVPQEIALYPALTGMQNLRFFASAAGLYGRRRTIRCRYLLEKVNLADKADKPVSTYSGGMQRRLNLACALVGDVKLLLLDEPTVGADENSTEIILNTITALKNGGCAVLLVSHRAEDIARVCDRAVKLKDGVVEDGSR